MECTKPTVNLCSRSECVQSTVTFEVVDRKPHLPNHGMFKVHRFIFYRDMGKIERTANDTLKYARETVSQLKEEENPMPMCLVCKTPVSLPCWCCVECTGEWETGNEQLFSHRDVVNTNGSIRQPRDSYAMIVNTNNSLSERHTPKCIQS